MRRAKLFLAGYSLYVQDSSHYAEPGLTRRRWRANRQAFWHPAPGARSLPWNRTLGQSFQAMTFTTSSFRWVIDPVGEGESTYTPGESRLPPAPTWSSRHSHLVRNLEPHGRISEGTSRTFPPPGRRHHQLLMSNLLFPPASPPQVQL